MAKIVRKNDEYLPRGYIYNYEELIDVAHNFNETTGAFSVKKEDDAGVYIFLRQELNSYRVIYIGQTESFVDRLDKYFKYHTQYECILRNQFTHVALLPLYTGEKYRLKVETDLRHYYSTLCNEQ